MRTLLVCFAGIVVTTMVGAAEWHVNAANYNVAYADAADYIAAGFDGTSAEKGFGTIQIAVDSAASGDTIKVAPGVYDKGITVDTCTNGGHRNRVVIDKSLTLVSTGGKAVTHIVGEKDPDTLNTSGRFGIGPKAVRCVLVTDGSFTVKIVGFTIRDGACGYSNGSDNLLHWGGGVAVNTASAGTGSSFNTSLVDCTVKACVATRGGGTRKVNAFRTLYTGCRGANVNNGGIARDGFFAHCVFFCNREYGMADSTVVNCTVVGLLNGNTFQQQGGQPCKVYNTYVAYASYDSDANTLFYNCALSGTTGKKDDCVSATWSEVISPATGDFRPVATGVLVGNAKRDYLSLIPEEYRYVDYTQAEIAQEGTLNIGAVQESVAPAGGRLVLKDFQSPTIVGTVDGFEEIYSGNMHAYPTVWPTQYVVRVTSYASDKKVWGLLRSQWSDYVFPDMSGNIYAVPPESGDLYLTPKLADAVYFVDPDPAKGSDSNSGTAASPFRTLQKAANTAAADKFTLVHCEEGTYAEGGAPDDSGVTNRLYVTKCMRFVGAGAGKSIIKGAADPAGVTHDGCGSAAVRCVCVATDHVAIQGFTLTDGHSSINGAQSAATMGDSPVLRGGGFLQYEDRLLTCLTDCVVTNCVASRGAAARGGRLIRCHFTGNTVMANSGGNSIVRTCRATACTFYNNTDRNGDILGQSARYYNCSVISKSGNAINRQGGTYTYNTLCSSDFDKLDLTLGCYHTSADCAFANAAAGDMRITTDSKGIGGGVIDGVENFIRYADGGIDGCRMTFVNSLPTCGAYQNPLRKFNVASALPGDSGITPSGTVLLAAGETAEVVVTPVLTRNYLGIEVNGDLIADVVRVTLSGGAYPPTAGEISVAAKYQTDWYVNAAAADDSGNGFSPETAKRTLAGAFGADVRAGDVVNCAAGEYAERTMTQSTLAYSKDADPTPTLPSRVVVPAGVTLRGAGAKTTFIVGSKDATETGDAHKRGPKAIRCAYLMNGAMLEGFTLRDGGTRGAVGGNEVETDNSIGGGVICSVSASTVLTTVRDCVISNCVAGRGGAAYGGRYVNCRIVGNIGVVNGTIRNAHAYNCYFNQNRSNGGILDYFYNAYNCTFGQGNFTILGTNVPGVADPMGTPTVANCLFLASGSINVAAANVVNCYHRTDFTIAAAKTSVNNVSCEPSALAVDADGVPVIGSCLAIDNADPAYYPFDICGDFDCAGNQRVWNGNMDVGAYEADWRPAYASMLGRRITVTKADPDVKMDEGGVSVRNGVLELTYCPRSAAAKVIVSASMSGTGTLDITKNGESVSTVTSGSYSGTFGGSAEPMSFVFSHELGSDDNGAAFISRFTYDDGLRLRIR